MKKFYVLCFCVALCATSVFGSGALSGKFSVGTSSQVRFAKGNLQYCATADEWRFAANQYTIIGAANANVGAEYDGWIDLFGWGTSGYNGKEPWMTSSTNTDYGDGVNNIAGTEYDWGVHNAIKNGGDEKGLWRTITNDEWIYLLSSRANALNYKGNATVNGVCGYVLLPDDWALVAPSGVPFTARPTDFTTNTYTVAQWQEMEDAGAVFLPACGYRHGTTVYSAGSLGYYQTSTSGSDGNGYHFWFYSGGLYTTETERSEAHGVRLIQDYAEFTVTTSATHGAITAKDEDGNVVDLSGPVPYGTVLVLTAVPDEGYELDAWTGYNGSRLVVKGDVSVSASFKKQMFTVTIVAEHGSVTAKDGGNNVVDLSEKVAYGTVLTLTAVPDEGYELDTWTNYNAATGLTVTGDVMVTATFKKQMFTVTVVSEHGTVTAKDGDDNVVDLSEKVAYGTVLTLSVVTDVDYRFDGWTNYDAASGLTVTGDVTVTANFHRIGANLDAVKADAEGCNEVRKVYREGRVLIVLPDGRVLNTVGVEVK